MAYSQGSLAGDVNGRFMQKPYYISFTDDSGTTSPISISATVDTLVAPSKAVYLNLKCVAEPVWFNLTTAATGTGYYVETGGSERIPVYPGAAISMVRAAATDATVCAMWEVLA